MSKGMAFGFAGLVLLVAVKAGSVHAAIVNETEPNNALGTAHNVDGSMTLAPNSFVHTSNGTDVSTIYPNATVFGTGDGTFDFYSFSVPVMGARGIFDVDLANFDSELFLFASDGTLLASNDNSPGTLASDTGSVSADDPFLQHIFADAGLHFIGVGKADSTGFDGEISGTAPELGDLYLLNIAVSETAVPEPTSMILFGSGIAGLVFHRRRKQRQAAARS